MPPLPPPGLSQCPTCGHWLDRVDHHAIQHTIFDDDVYREVSIADGGVIEFPHGIRQEFGLASEIQLRCGYCSQQLSREARTYFFRHWQAVLEALKRQ